MNFFATHRYLRQLLIGLATSWLITSFNHALAAEALVWKFAVGDVHHYQMVQEIRMSMDLGPEGETVSTVKQTLDMSWEVESIDESGAARIAQKISRTQIDIAAPGQANVRYDTASDASPQGYATMLAPVLTALTTSTFKFTLSATGEITDVEIPESYLEVLSRSPGASTMGGLATAEGFKGMISQGGLTLPQSEDLIAGQEWSTLSEVASPATGKITTITTYHYAGSREIDGQQFEVFVPKIETRFGEAEKTNTANVELTNQESSGEILFNRSAGRLEFSTISMRMESVITAGINTIHQKLNQKVQFKIVEPSEAAR